MVSIYKYLRTYTACIVLLICLLIPCLAIADVSQIMDVHMMELVEGDREAASESLAVELSEIHSFTFQEHSKGSDVRSIQTRLAALGYMSKNDINANYDHKTVQAVSQFQKDMGLRETGETDAATLLYIVLKSEGSSFKQNKDNYTAEAGRFEIVFWPEHSLYIGSTRKDGTFYRGTYLFSSGEYYTGEFKENRRTGQGNAYFPNGDSYTGEWDKDQMNGNGTYTFGGENSGEYYKGKWKDDCMHGQGTYVLKDGTKISGSWENNQHKGW